MRVTVSNICRASGKIFVLFSIKELQADSLLELVPQNCQGINLPPCTLYEFDNNEKQGNARCFVGVFPILGRRSDSFILTEKDKLGNIIDSYTYRLNYEKAKWQSRINYRSKPDACNAIRDYDKRYDLDKATIKFNMSFNDDDEMILRCTLQTPYKENSKLSVAVYNDKLEPVSPSSVFLGASQAKLFNLPNQIAHREDISVRLPRHPGRYIFLLNDKNHPEFNSFEVLEEHDFNILLAGGDRHALDAQVDPRYSDWFKSHRATTAEIKKQAEVPFSYSPLYSIIVPLFNTPLDLFQEMVQSARDQSYRNWELILINASPDNLELKQSVADEVQQDSRIKVITLNQNYGIAGNTNEGIRAATGDFVCFFDHDDLIEPDLLFHYTCALNNNDEIDLLYCDEDKLMSNGTYTQPFFKPDFDVDLLRSQNYICHMLCIRKSLLDALELSSSNYDGAQDHDLTLKATEKARAIHHVPRVLYHWRITESSTAANEDSKPYAATAGIKAVQAHLDRLGIKATVRPSGHRPFIYKVDYAVPEPTPLVSIVIPNKDQVDLLKRCVDSIKQKTTYQNYEIIIVENNSDNPQTFEYYQKLQKEGLQHIKVVTWQDQGFNFSKLINFGVKHASGSYFMLLNNDTEVITSNWIEQLVGICSRKDVGAVGVKLFYPDNLIQHAGVGVAGDVAGHLGCARPRSSAGYFALLDSQRQLSAVTAACMMVRKDVFELVGGFTEDIAVSFNDVDFCLKIREQNLAIVYTPEVELYHYESVSRGTDDMEISRKIRFKKECAYMHSRWAEHYAKGDPFMNPNFDQSEPGIFFYWLS